VPKALFRADFGLQLRNPGWNLRHSEDTLRILRSSISVVVRRTTKGTPEGGAQGGIAPGAEGAFRRSRKREKGTSAFHSSCGWGSLLTTVS